MNALPLPSQLNRAQTLGAYNFEWQDTLEVPKNFQILRLDFHPTTKDSIYLRARRWNTDTRAFNAGACFGGGLPLARCRYLFTDDSAQVGYTRVISPTVVNEFNIGMRGLKEIGKQISGSEFDPVTRSKTGFTLSQFYPGSNPLGLIPQMSFGGVPSAGGFNFDTRLPIDAGDQRVNVSNNFSLIRGSHNPKFGVYFEHTDTSEGPRTNVSYSGYFDFGRDPNNPLDTGYAYSNAALGNFRLYNEATNVTTDKGRNNIFEWFAQDTWKVTRRLTELRHTVLPHTAYSVEGACHWSGFCSEPLRPLQGASAVPTGAGCQWQASSSKSDYRRVPSRGLYRCLRARLGRSGQRDGSLFRHQLSRWF